DTTKVCRTASDEDNLQFLRKVFDQHFLFSDLDDDDLKFIHKHMRPQLVEDGARILEQGDKGVSFHIIRSGTFVVIIDGERVSQLTESQTFGEFSLVYSCARTATVVCNVDGELWSIDRACFRYCLEKVKSKHSQRILEFFQHDHAFRQLSENDRKRLAGACTLQVFTQGQEVIREGEVGQWMFIVVEGFLQTLEGSGKSGRASPGTILGSEAVIYSKRHTVRAKAIDRVTCLALGKYAFSRLLGPIEHVVRRSALKSLLLKSDGSKDLDFFKHLSSSQSDSLIDRFEKASFTQGEVIAAAGSRAQLIVVKAGEVAVLLPDASEVFPLTPEAALFRAESALEVLHAGQSYGAYSLVDGTVVTHTLVALTAAQVHRVSAAAVVGALMGQLSDVIR
ncbi:unnamed protein product, partial [Polarella glacialis]